MPSKTPYLRFGEAERPIMGPAVEIVGNAKALLHAEPLRFARATPRGYPDPPVMVASRTSAPGWSAMAARISSSQGAFSSCPWADSASVSPSGPRSLHL
jgi:hypothetical protein